jgi:hypothetical protein
VILHKFPEAAREVEAVDGWVYVDLNACPMFLVPV